MLKRTFMILNLLLSTLANSRIHNPDNEDKIVRQLISIYGDYYDEQGSVVFVVGNEDVISGHVMKYVQQNGRQNVVNTTPDCRSMTKFQAIGRITMMFLFIGNSPRPINEMFRCFKETVRIPTKIVLTTLSTESLGEIESIFRSLWSQKILNVVIVTVFSGSIRVFGYNPYFGRYCEDLTGQDVFYDKLKDMNGYCVNLFLTKPEDFTKVHVYKIGAETKFMGKDGMTIQSILWHSNATTNVIDLQKIFDLDNPWRPMNRFLKEHLKKPAIDKYQPDIFMDSMAVEVNNFTDFLYPHGRDDYTVILGKAEYVPVSKHLFRIFKEGAFLIILFLTVAYPVVWSVMTIVQDFLGAKKLKKLHVFLDTIFDNFRLVLGFPINTLRINFMHSYFLAWLLFANLVVSNYFQSILMSILTVFDRESEIDTIKDLVESGVLPYTAKVFAEQISKILSSSGSKYIPKFQVLLPRMFETKYKDLDKNFTVVLERDRSEAMQLICPIFHVMKEVLFPSHVSYHVVKGSPYYDLLSKYVPRVLESGLYGFWKRESFHVFFLQEGLCNAAKDDSSMTYKAFGMKNLHIVFCLLFSGWIIGGIVFVIEIIFKHTISRRK